LSRDSKRHFAGEAGILDKRASRETKQTKNGIEKNPALLRVSPTKKGISPLGNESLAPDEEISTDFKFDQLREDRDRRLIYRRVGLPPTNCNQTIPPGRLVELNRPNKSVDRLVDFLHSKQPSDANSCKYIPRKLTETLQQAQRFEKKDVIESSKVTR
jgi:hypothetical protein